MMLDEAIQEQQRGDFDSAIALYRDILDKNPNDPIVLHNMGLCYAMQKEWSEALSYLEHATVVAPQNATFHNNFGNALRASGQLQRAQAHYEMALSLQGNYPEAHNNLGALLYRQEKIETALTHFKKALRFAPGYADAHTNLGHCYALQNKPKEAITHYEAALRLQPHNHIVRHNLGITYAQTCQWQAAYPHLMASLAKEADNPETRYHLGLVETNLGRHQKAVTHYKAVLTHTPHHANATHNLATCYLEVGALEEALFYFEQALVLNADNATAAHMLKALRGEQVTRCAQAYIQQLFDSYAPGYNQHLRVTLGYTLPEAIREQIGPYASRMSGRSYALDLGCGTGLMAPYLHDLISELHGVDLSAKMLDIARQQGGYAALHQADLNEYMSTTNIRWDLIVAAEVFNYVGDLEVVFRHACDILNESGLFVFSIETADKPNYQLSQSGRFLHHPDYIQQLAQRHGLAILNRASLSLRQAQDSPVPGQLYILSPCERHNV